MALDPKYILATNLQEFIIDEDTGLPLSNGYIKFFSDVNRTQPKPVFQLSGYPDYGYTELQNPLPLSSVGTTVDEFGNDIRVYYYPYDANGNLELYYVEVYGSDDQLKFVRQAWPNFFVSNGVNAENDAFNFIPNGQFLAHYNVQGDPANNVPFGQITQDVTVLAPGGWTFERSTGSTAIDNVQFFRYGAYVADPSASPRYAAQITCDGVNPSDLFKNLCVKFSDVNKFASGTQDYTFFFEGYTVASGNIDVTIYIKKYFGTGGSPNPDIITQIETFTLTSAKTLFQATINFGDNLGLGLGLNNDDYIQIEIGFPTNQTYNALLTGFGMLFGEVIVESFPVQTDADVLSRSLTLPVPDPNGWDLGLPIVSIKEGLGYDDSVIGDITASGCANLPALKLPCDGSSYPVDGYSDEGIPYKRLYNKITDLSSPIAAFGNGYGFVSIFDYGVNETTDATHLILTTNQPGAQTNTADGAVPTGFTFSPNICLGASAYGLKAYYCATNGVCIINDAPGVPVAPNNVQTSPFIMNILHPGQPSSPQLISLKTSLPVTPGLFLDICTPTQICRIWFTVDGAGSPPAPPSPGVSIKIAVLSTFTILDLYRAIAAALSSFQASPFTVVSGASITNSSYFTFNANSQLYYVYMSLNGSGADPNLAGGIGMECTYSSSNTSNEIGQRVITAISSKYYATPDLRGVFIRGLDTGANIDLDVLNRYARNYYNYGNRIGSMQFTEILDHYHSQVYGSSGPSGSTPNIGQVTGGTQSTYSIGDTGGSESRPPNMALNYFIRY